MHDSGVQMWSSAFLNVVLHTSVAVTSSQTSTGLLVTMPALDVWPETVNILGRKRHGPVWRGLPVTSHILGLSCRQAYLEGSMSAEVCNVFLYP